MRTLLTLVVAATTIGCGTLPPLAQAPRPCVDASFFESSHHVIALDALVPQRDRSLFDIVTRTWPAMLRGPLSPSNVAYRGPQDAIGVYADGAFVGGPEALRHLYGRNVVQMRRLTMAEEFFKFGHAHPGGAVVLEWRIPGR